MLLTKFLYGFNLRKSWQSSSMAMMHHWQNCNTALCLKTVDNCLVWPWYIIDKIPVKLWLKKTLTIFWYCHETSLTNFQYGHMSKNNWQLSCMATIYHWKNSGMALPEKKIDYCQLCPHWQFSCTALSIECCMKALT